MSTFSPTAVGMYTDTLEVDSDGGDEVVTLTGTSTPSSVLTISPLAIDYGNVGPRTVGHRDIPGAATSGAAA